MDRPPESPSLFRFFLLVFVVVPCALEWTASPHVSPAKKISALRPLDRHSFCVAEKSSCVGLARYIHPSIHTSNFDLKNGAVGPTRASVHVAVAVAVLISRVASLLSSRCSPTISVLISDCDSPLIDDVQNQQPPHPPVRRLQPYPSTFFFQLTLILHQPTPSASCQQPQPSRPYVLETSTRSNHPLPNRLLRTSPARSPCRVVCEPGFDPSTTPAVRGSWEKRPSTASTRHLWPRYDAAGDSSSAGVVRSGGRGSDENGGCARPIADRPLRRNVIKA